MSYTHDRLGKLLVESGLVTPEQVQEALQEQARDGGRLGRILVERLVVSEDQLADTLASQKDLPRITLAGYAIDPRATVLVPSRIARRRDVMPLGFDGDGGIFVAMADPLDIEALDEVALHSGKRPVPMVATASEIRRAVDKYLTSRDVFEDVIDSTIRIVESPEAQEAGALDVPVVRLVNQLIREAIADRASDIHLEPFHRDVRVRYRVDGVLNEVMRLPLSTHRGITSRIKIMADMDITERRRSQDGRILLKVDGRPVDLRVATLPTPRGESIVIRVMSHGLSFRTLEMLGMNDRHLATLDRLLRRPYGAILLSGPTGCGKSTSLYACLKRLNDDTRKIVTVEEPIEYEMEGVTQVAVNKAVGMTFASGLRQILRSDPDIVMVGEIRDPETAQTSVRAALTGHLVLSSIHTNDAPSALTRLTDLQVPPFVTSSALLGVLAQRLVRRLCERCKEPVDPDVAGAHMLDLDPGALRGKTVFGPVGCPECLGTGYRGRIGVFEMMVVDDAIRELVLRHASSDAIRAVAIKRGMRTLRDDVLDKVYDGVTSLEEAARVIV